MAPGPAAVVILNRSRSMPMVCVRDVPLGGLTAAEARLADAVCDRFEAACRAGGRPRVEDSYAPGQPGCRAVLRELVTINALYRWTAPLRPLTGDR